MTTLPRFIDLKDIATDTPTDLTCGRVFHVFSVLNPLKHKARIEMIAEEGRGKTFYYRAKNVKNLKELAEKLRLAMFEINCDLSWSGRVMFTRQSVEFEAANQRNNKTLGDHHIHSYAIGQDEWVV